VVIGLVKERSYALSPAANSGKYKDSLHEHGMGLKIALYSLGTTHQKPHGLVGFKLFTKHRDDNCITKIQNLSYSDISDEPVDDASMFPQGHGTMIEISNLKDKLPTQKEHYKYLVNFLGCRYQYYLRAAHNKKLNMTLRLTDKSGSTITDVGGRPCQYTVNAIEATFKDKQLLEDVPLAIGKGTGSRAWKAHLRFGWAPTEEEFAKFPDGDSAKDQLDRKHPYYYRNLKIDIVRNDIVLGQVDYSWLTDKSLASIERDWRGGYLPRMQIIIESGLSTTHTKSGLEQSADVEELKAEVWKIIEPYTERDKNRIVDNETLFKDKLEAKLNALCSNVKRETTTSSYGFRADFSLNRRGNDEIWEIKMEEGTGPDVMQLLGYLITSSVKKGVLLANGFNPNAKSFVNDINAGKIIPGCTIELLDAKTFA
jgi:hypothetical protein